MQGDEGDEDGGGVGKENQPTLFCRSNLLSRDIYARQGFQDRELAVHGGGQGGREGRRVAVGVREE